MGGKREYAHSGTCRSGFSEKKGPKVQKKGFGASNTTRGKRRTTNTKELRKIYIRRVGGWGSKGENRI